MTDILILFVIVVSVSCWTGAILRISTGRPLVAYQSRRPVPWGVGDLLFALLVLLLFQALAIDLVSRLCILTDMRQMAEILGSAVGSLATVFVSAAVIFLRTGSRWRDVGFDRRYVGADLWLGVIAFLMLAPPVYGLQHLLTRWFPSEHPLIALLTENGSLPVYLVVGFSAAIVAPLAEEYLFRVLLQGWIEGALQPADESVGTTIDHSAPRPLGVTKDGMPQGCLASGATGTRWLPIILSATLFAGMHASHGPDPIPLFVLAVGLGYLYQRTHRILPCITVHFLLNGVTLATFLLSAETG